MSRLDEVTENYHIWNQYNHNTEEEIKIFILQSISETLAMIYDRIESRSNISDFSYKLP